MRGDLHDIGILVRDEFALGDRKAEQAITRWTAENRPRSLLNAQWQRFRTAMQDRWEPQTPFDPDNRDDLNAARNLVIHDIDELLNRMIEHYRLTETRSEERRVGKEGVSTFRFRWQTYLYKKNKSISAIKLYKRKQKR